MCDDSCEVYADGFLIGSTSTYEELGQFSISQSTRVIAIEADDVGKASGDWRLFGLIVRIKEFISDKSWMCSGDVTHGWNQPVYTMSRSWQRAKTRPCNTPLVCLVTPSGSGDHLLILCFVVEITVSRFTVLSSFIMQLFIICSQQTRYLVPMLGQRRRVVFQATITSHSKLFFFTLT